MDHVNAKDLRFQTPVRIVISSASQTGKTEKLLLFIKYRERLFNEPFTKIIFFSPSNVELSHELELRLRSACADIEFQADVPKSADFSEYSRFNSNTLFIFDDLSAQIVSSKPMLHFFTAASHHSRISCLFTLQSQYTPGPHSKTIVRQCHYRFILQDRADKLSLRYLTQQLFPDAPSSFLAHCFLWLQTHEKNQYERYLLLDMDNRSLLGDHFQVRSRIFPNEEGIIEPLLFSPI